MGLNRGPSDCELSILPIDQSANSFIVHKIVVSPNKTFEQLVKISLNCLFNCFNCDYDRRKQLFHFHRSRCMGLRHCLLVKAAES